MSKLKIAQRYSKTQQVFAPKSSLQTSVDQFNITQTIIKQCRICLINQQQGPDHNFIRPCKCAGTVKYVHQACMKTWIKSSLQTKSKQQQEKIISEGIQCQLCKYLIKFQFKVQYGCYKCSETGKLICEKRLLFLIVIFLFLVSCVGFSFSIYTILTSPEIKNTQNGLQFQIILSFCGVGLLFLFLMLGIYTYVGQFMIKKQIGFGQIKQYSALQIYSRTNNQIIPIEDDSLFQIPQVRVREN